jgi:hypothetical protein
MHMLAPSSDRITLAEINSGGTPVCIPTGPIIYDAEGDTSKVRIRYSKPDPTIRFS